MRPEYRTPGTPVVFIPAPERGLMPFEDFAPGEWLQSPESGYVGLKLSEQDIRFFSGGHGSTDGTCRYVTPGKKYRRVKVAIHVSPF